MASKNGYKYADPIFSELSLNYVIIKFNLLEINANDMVMSWIWRVVGMNPGRLNNIDVIMRSGEIHIEFQLATKDTWSLL